MAATYECFSTKSFDFIMLSVEKVIINHKKNTKVHDLDLTKINAHNLEIILIRPIWWGWALCSTFDTHLFSPLLYHCVSLAIMRARGVARGGSVGGLTNLQIS